MPIGADRYDRLLAAISGLDKATSVDEIIGLTRGEDLSRLASPHHRRAKLGGTREEGIMKTARHIAIGLVVGMLLGASATAAFAQATTPIGPQWWPSRWGTGDEAGASNLMTPEKVLEAIKLVTTGKVYRLGRPYEPGMPMRGLRNYKLVIPSFPTAGPFAKNRLIFNEEFVTGEIGQVGTQ